MHLPPLLRSTLFPLAFAIASTQASAGEDSTRVYRVADVVISATRWDLPVTDSPSSCSIIPVAQDRLVLGTSAADLLRTVAGVTLRDNGPNGQLKTVSLRGLSAENVLVLLDGVRLNSMQNGLADLSLVPLDHLDRIELVRGGSSALYGGDASAGVLHLMTRRSRPGLNARAEAFAGSFGYQRFGLFLSQGWTAGSLIAGVASERADDDYEFTMPRIGAPDSAMQLHNADFRRTHAYATGAFDLGSRSTFRATLSGVRASRGLPGSITPGIPYQRARQDDDQVNASAAIRTAIDEAVFSMNTGYQYSWQRYDDPDWGFSSRYRYTYMFANPHAEFLIAPWYRLSAGAEFAQGQLSGNDFEAPVQRIQRSLYASNEFAVQRDGDLLDRATLFITGRYDDVQSIASAFTPKLGANVRVWKEIDLRVRGSYSGNFRVPTLNDLYFRGFSNPDLKPEYSTTKDLGLLFVLGSSTAHRFEATRFWVDAKDRIVFDMLAFRPENIGRVESDGWEFRYEGTAPSGWMSWFADVTLTRATEVTAFIAGFPPLENPVPYVPERAGNVGVNLSLDGFSARFTHSASGQRRTSFGPRELLRSFMRTDVSASYRVEFFSLETRIQGEMTNLFDTQYEVFPGYPMPGRAFRVGISLER